MKREITEKELEDWICENPHAFLGQNTKILERQLRVPSGIIDLLMFERRLYIVELKVEKLKEKDIGQVLRYTYDIRAELKRTAYLRSPFPKPVKNTVESNLQKRQREWYFMKHGWIEKSSGHFRTTTQPVLMGSGVHINVLKAAEAAGIIVFGYHYDGVTEKIKIIPICIPESWYTKRQPVRDWAWEVNQYATFSTYLNYPPKEEIFDFVFGN